MAETFKTHRLIIASIIFVAIILIGFLTFKTPDLKYELNIDQTVKMLDQSAMITDPAFPNKLILSGENDLLLIDIRNPHEFQKGHPSGAINIPVSEILYKENMAFLEKSSKYGMKIIFYGNNASDVNGVWMVLQQIGLQGIEMFTGGYQVLAQIDQKNDNQNDKDYVVEKIRFDISLTNQTVTSNTENTSQEKLKKIIPIRKEKKTATAGGC